MLSPARGQVTHVLLTRAPLYRGRSPFSCDLHVLGAPLTFALSQDQTLQLRTVSVLREVRLRASHGSRNVPRILPGRDRTDGTHSLRMAIRFSFQGTSSARQGRREGRGSLVKRHPLSRNF